MTVPGPVSVLIAEDHAVVREGTREMLERDDQIVVVGEAADGPTAVSLAAELTPDVLLLDMNLPVFNGIQRPDDEPEVGPTNDNKTSR